MNIEKLHKSVHAIKFYKCYYFDVLHIPLFHSGRHYRDQCKAHWAYITLLRYFPKGLKLLYTTSI